MADDKRVSADFRDADVSGQVSVGSGNRQTQTQRTAAGGGKSRPDTWAKIGVIAGVVAAVAAIVALFLM
jgi:hypothetical protein